MSNEPLGYNQFIRVLIPFDLIIDTDVGLIKLIQSDYMDPDIFNIHMLENMTTGDIISYSMNRIYENPLYGLSVLDKESFSELDELYEDFMNTKYREILELSDTTYLAMVYELFSKTPGVKVFVYYNSKLELEVLKNFHYNLIDCTESKMNLRRMKEYDAIYVKYPSSVSYKLEGKTLYFGNYGFNYLFFDDKNKEPILRPEILVLSVHNIIKFSNIYMVDDGSQYNEINEEEEEDENE